MCVLTCIRQIKSILNKREDKAYRQLHCINITGASAALQSLTVSITFKDQC